MDGRGATAATLAPFAGPSWAWPAATPAAPLFVYFDATAYPPSMDECMQAHLPLCSLKTGGAFRQCADTVLARCQQDSLRSSAVYEPVVAP